MYKTNSVVYTYKRTNVIANIVKADGRKAACLNA